VLLEYDRMKDANKAVINFHEKKQYKLLANYESLKRSMDDFEKKSTSLSKNEINILQKSLEEKKIKTTEFESNIQLQADSIYNSLKLLVIEDINRFIQVHAKEQNYSYVLGNWEDGHIMYGKSDKDITSDVIKGLNE